MRIWEKDYCGDLYTKEKHKNKILVTDEEIGLRVIHRKLQDLKQNQWMGCLNIQEL